MRTPTRLGVYGLALAAVLGGGFVAGALFGPSTAADDDRPARPAPAPAVHETEGADDDPH